jgi:type IV pilus assembly protein PilW
MMRRTQLYPLARGAQHGFTLVELMVTVAIALFLLYGLVTTVQNVRQTSLNQQKLAQLQDAQRFAMTVVTDVIQAGGYFPDPTLQSLNSFGVWGATANSDALAPGQVFGGLYGGGVQPGDRIDVRFMTASGDGVLNCLGGTNVSGATQTYVNTFSVVLEPANVGGGDLQCSLNGVAPVTLVSGVVNLQIYYGVKRNPTPIDYNVDTYLRPDQMTAADWPTISSVKVIMTFVNPLYTGLAGSTIPQYITLDRVVEVMARAGNYTS